MLAIPVKTIVNTNINILAKSIADTNTFVTILFTVLTFSNVHFSVVI